MSSRTIRKSLSKFAVATCFLFIGSIAGLASQGCNGVDDDGNVNEFDPCFEASCASDQYGLTCTKIGGFGYKYFCLNTNPTGDGESECDSRVGVTSQSRGVMACSDGATGGYPLWDPDASIDLVSGVYEVDSALVDEVISDFNVVTVEDSARILWQRGGYAKVVSISSTDMMHHLGFQNNDVILSVSDAAGSTSLNSWYNMLDAVGTYGSATSLSISVERGGVTVTLDYSII